ncbi:DUF4290 domain-containing protein [Xylanibacter rodentium]|jgi:hypothetical protein|uniref:DUF4290 domain-containing protein n=1 Tax=Xylanibacter rodentium TaxID=2736289 RepID=A0ABX2B0Z0_9BACT|nr:DUF4290 domain-containing protein [Xylanibacter rodentium]NPE12117.1 DUF4290 domain-containing protein [Prevotella sp. PJ1A]NPE15183.1 DUF4290 domain-containing protein [Xylanibacter rodentium]NPE39341.1 DUF4290 domain-containing protein [Prevotella sp. PCJ2]
MEITGLDYNTQREPLMMPEYGREIQKMVDYAVALPTREERQSCAESIVRMMGTKVTQQHENSDFEHTLWDHLYLMSHKKLDIEWPYDMSEAEKILAKPEPMKLPGKGDRVQLRHYGHLMEEIFRRLKEMPEGEERDELTRIAANQMKRDLATWGHGSMDDERVASDLANYTDGKIQLDLSTFRFERPVIQSETGDMQRKKKRK